MRLSSKLVCCIWNLSLRFIVSPSLSSTQNGRGCPQGERGGVRMCQQHNRPSANLAVLFQIVAAVNDASVEPLGGRRCRSRPEFSPVRPRLWCVPCAALASSFSNATLFPCWKLNRCNARSAGRLLNWPWTRACRASGLSRTARFAAGPSKWWRSARLDKFCRWMCWAVNRNSTSGYET